LNKGTQCDSEGERSSLLTKPPTSPGILHELKPDFLVLYMQHLSTA